MTRNRSAKQAVRLVTPALLALGALSLSGCLYSSIPAEPPVVADPIPSPDPTEDAPSPEGDLPATLSFEDGAALPATAYIEWGDGLMVDDGWEVTAPDDGNGGWSYGTIDGTCTAQFWQGLTSDVQTTPGDDQASSDAVLGVLLQTDAASVAPHAVDESFVYQLGGDRDVAFRQVSGQQDGRSWIMSARAFTATGVGLYVIVDCTGGDANAVLDEVIEKNAIVVH